MSHYTTYLPCQERASSHRLTSRDRSTYRVHSALFRYRSLQRADKQRHAHFGNHDPTGTTARAETTRGAPPGLQESRIKTQIREAQNPSSELESTRTDISAGIPIIAALRQRRQTRPFATWPNLRDSFPDHLEVQRFNALPAHQQEHAWRYSRRHAPCDMEVIPALDLDALY
jgi:hypothetical protein